MTYQESLSSHIQVAVRAWLFLGERLTGRQVAGMVLSALGTLAVQIHRQQRR